jgi:hypothetical protein
LARKTKSHLSIKPSSQLPACKTINLLPFPEGIFGASEPSTGNHKLSYKIIFQNTTFLFSPLKLKKQLYEKIQFKKLLSVFKTKTITLGLFNAGIS